jgi:hypothetical protein
LSALSAIAVMYGSIVKLKDYEAILIFSAQSHMLCIELCYTQNNLHVLGVVCVAETMDDPTILLS